MPLPRVKFELIETMADPATGPIPSSIVDRLKEENPDLYEAMMDIGHEQGEWILKGMFLTYHLLATQLDCDELAAGDA